jgi:stearoyl-CoA 9-desaturase NADPH oxidoreductase
MNSVASRLLAALVHPRSVDDFLELVQPLYSSWEARARVVDVRPETHDVATLVLQPNGQWRGHRAGQHVGLTVEIRGVRRTRYFSVASGEGTDGPIELTVKARSGGAVTPYLVSGALRGAVVTLSAPAGSFVLPDVLPERTLLVSGGSGITPVMSMLRTLVASRAQRPVTFVHYARSASDVIFADELASLSANVCAPRRRASRGPDVHVLTGPLEPEAFARLVPDFETYETWACGPAAFLSALQQAFAVRGAAERVRVERFSLDAPSGDEEAEVSFVRSRATVTGSGPLLALAERAGLAPPSGCRMGICRTCSCRKVHGTTRDVRTGEVSSEEAVDIQLCVHEAVGRVALDL